jgi:hypothetical protein
VRWPVGSGRATCSGHGRGERWRRAAGPWDPVEKMAGGPDVHTSALGSSPAASGPASCRYGLPRAGVLQDADTVATGGCRTTPGAWALVESHCQVNNVGTHTHKHVLNVRGSTCSNVPAAGVGKREEECDRCCMESASCEHCVASGREG